jgi:hypothetical protein
MKFIERFISEDGTFSTAIISETFSQLRHNQNHQLLMSLASVLIKDHPILMQPWLEYGKSLQENGHSATAEIYFRHAALMIPNQIVPLLLLGNCLLHKCSGHRKSKSAILDTLDIWKPSFNADLVLEIGHITDDLISNGFFDEAKNISNIMLSSIDDESSLPYLNTLTRLISCDLNTSNFHSASKAMVQWYKSGNNLPVWQGENLNDKELCVFADHGYGDIIQFSRYVIKISKTAKKTYLILNKSLHHLFRNIDTIHLCDDVPGRYDYIISLYVLPHVYGITATTAQFETPYLHCDPTQIARWKHRLPHSGFNIGIAWQGGGFDLERSIPVKLFASLTHLPGVNLISLQAHDGLEQLNDLPLGMTIMSLGEDYDVGENKFGDAAAVIANLDLVITIDTSIAHLAGALGCPVWTLLKVVPDWRWGMGQADTPWYPTMRLFRQKTKGDWDDVMDRVVMELGKTLELIP